ncbi:NAD-dependent epimerase/dehydratase family protein [Spirillospora sp. NPDC047279]|uniref:NAD-dependent epimerase/dehydratase family protein n=1 Tax=Spirillospora sp. NPDC047279 TaxID=3155478 RepID=UPI0033FDEFE5
MKVLLTGSAGFIGSHVADVLTAAGHSVRGLDNGTDAREDVRDATTVRHALRDVDAVCHQAAMVGLGVDVFDLPGYASVNVHGTAVLLAEMARADVHHLVLASSMVVYGEGAYRCDEHGVVRPGPRAEKALGAGLFEPGCPRCGRPLAPGTVGEEAPLDPRNVYADTKLAQEHLAASWARMTGGSVAALRYHNVYGPRMPRDTPYAGVAALFRSRLERGEPPLVFEDGRQRRDFVHVRDVARANLLALDHVVAGDAGAFRAYNIASGGPRTIADMAGALAAAYGGPEPRVTGGYRLGDVRHIVASPERARCELGFRAEVSFSDGMAEFAGAGAVA